MVYDEKFEEKVQVFGLEVLWQSEVNAGKKGCEELCGIEPYCLIRCQWSNDRFHLSLRVCCGSETGW